MALALAGDGRIWKMAPSVPFSQRYACKVKLLSERKGWNSNVNPF